MDDKEDVCESVLLAYRKCCEDKGIKFGPISVISVNTKSPPDDAGWKQRLSQRMNEQYDPDN